jgi:UDP-N-acetylglucosamine 2-epimerase (non-hydrolysing)
LFEKITNCKNVKLIDPTGYTDFVCLLQNSSKIVTDSGGVQKEAYLLSIPCITIRKNTEWVETVEAGWNVLVDTNTEKITKYVRDWVPSNDRTTPIFGKGNTSELIKNEILK